MTKSIIELTSSGKFGILIFFAVIFVIVVLKYCLHSWLAYTYNVQVFELLCQRLNRLIMFHHRQASFFLANVVVVVVA